MNVRIQRTSSLLLVMSLVMTTFIFPSTASAGMAFQDISQNYPYSEAVASLKLSGVIKGYDNGNFLPDNTINRAEFMKILMGSLMASPKGHDCFHDVKSEWYAPYVCAAKEQGIIQGYPDDTFRPGLNISVVEASKVLVRAYELKVDMGAGTGTSSPKGEPWYKPYVVTLQNKNAIPVSIDYPEKKISRGEMAEMTWRVKAQVSDKSSKTFASLTSDLPQISSCVELKDKLALQSYRQERVTPYMMKSMLGAPPEANVDTAIPPTAAPTPVSAQDSTTPTSGAADDFSSTNTQVAGVDEADIVKNDGQYIYLIKGRSIRIVKATPANDMKELSQITVNETSFTPSEMFVTGNTLVVVGNSYSQTSQTVVFIYDITDRSNVKQLRRLEFEGNYVSSRRIGQYAYFVMNAYPRYELLGTGTGGTSADSLVPLFTDSKVGKAVPVVGCSTIRAFPRYDQPNFLIVAGVSLGDAANASVSRQAYLGSGSTVYSSLESLYVSTQKYEYNDMQAYDIWAPPITKTSSVFYRFGLNNGAVDLKSHGEVPGTLLNQFSMDENGDAFRVATSQGNFWNPNSQPTNQLYILDRNNLQTILGKVENIGQGEKIKAVRFMGKRAYVVTFKNTDPFFVIDVENASAPKILGELKIPGYSDYLHPYDENHIIGFGKDAVDASQFQDLDNGFLPGRENFAWYQGMKLAMFDVTDPVNPKEMFKEVIGDRGTQSDLLYNHKALLFSKEKGLMAFPIQVAEIKNKETAKIDPSTYGEITFRGAYVYSVDLTKGFVLKGKVTHVDSSDFSTPADTGTGSGGAGGATPMTKIWNPDGGPYFNNYNALIQRLAYIGNSLYSVSMKKVSANSLTDMSEQGSVTLAKEPEGDGGPIIMY